MGTTDVLGFRSSVTSQRSLADYNAEDELIYYPLRWTQVICRDRAICALDNDLTWVRFPGRDTRGGARWTGCLSLHQSLVPLMQCGYVHAQLRQKFTCESCEGITHGLVVTLATYYTLYPRG